MKGGKIMYTNDKVIVPPIKCQGIKTKLIPFIRDNLEWTDEEGVWIEPFVGTGVVLFNIAPQKAICSDRNKHIINFYKGIQSKKITAKSVREYLEYHGAILAERGEEYYKEMRASFNENGDPMAFLFLNRSDFNGMIRFNKKGGFNVPFCKKPERFSKSYITKICNQVQAVADVMEGKDWTFLHCDWRDTMKKANKGDFIYLDPPYIGRDTSYVGEWSQEDAVDLSKYSHESKAKVALSMWKENKYRVNEHLIEYWSDFEMREVKHFYFIGAKESNRNAMTEVLAINNPLLNK